MKAKKFITLAAISTMAFITVYSCMLSIGGGVSTTTTTVISSLSEHLISARQAKMLTDEYATKNYKMVSAGKSQAETKEVYYDIDVLEDYIKYVKEEAKKKKINNVGIVIAFGQYPNNDNFDSRLKKNYQGQQTVYLKAATKPSESQKVGMGGYSAQLNAKGIEEISAFDFGNLTPPE